jgi:hypothetical protein
VNNERPEIDLNDLLVQKAKFGELVVGAAPQNVSLETKVAIEKMTDNLKAKSSAEN